MDVDLWANLAAEVFEQLAREIEKQTSEQSAGRRTNAARGAARRGHSHADVIGEAERNRDAVLSELTASEAMKDTLEGRARSRSAARSAGDPDRGRGERLGR
jgi:hypothetical protein